MGGRIAFAAALVALSAAVLLNRRKPEPPAPVRPANTRPVTIRPALRPFGPAYAAALEGVLDLEPPDVERLERQLESNPEDHLARLKVMAYYARADRGGKQDQANRARHALWLIERHPDSDGLRSYLSRFSPGQLPAGDYERALALWGEAAGTRPKDAAVQFNAAAFFIDLAPDLHRRYLESTIAADPNHATAALLLGGVYARMAVQGSVDRAAVALDASQNPLVLNTAARALQGFASVGARRGIAELAERCKARAIALDPDGAIQRQPEAEPPPPQISTKTFDDAQHEIRRLPVDAFPDLPSAIAGVMRARRCTVPQPFGETEPRNVIRGEFYRKGQPSWAALCSVDGVSTLLVFRHDADLNPDTMSSREDRGFLQGMGGDRVGYSRGISAVGRTFILRHYRAYGGPEPPPIDHDGIDDAFLGKASATLYFHQGKWICLQGAD